ncbi:MAG: hypothetical protein VKJ04_07965, partial [Vampirovibrionales bacterium]|nr:hypothetical protein [Vampirovibrionales bacterium]
VSMRLRNKIPLFYLQYFPCNSNLCYYPKTLLPLGTHHGSRSDIVSTIIDTAKNERITQVVVGESLRAPGILSFLKPPLPYQIFNKTKTIDIYIVAAD